MAVKGRRRTLLLFVFIGLTVLFFWWDPEPTFRPQPLDVEVSERAKKLHDDAVVIDLHVDPLLWPRDLTRARDGGHVDFPRMRDGGLDGAAFGVPTAFFAAAGLKAFHDRWPVRTWFSRWERTNYQMGKLEARSRSGEIIVTRDPDRFAEGSALYGFFGIEGAHGLGADVSRVHELAARGVAFIGPVHLSDNAYGGSASGLRGGGLTRLGASLIAEMNRAGVLVDLAHASPQTFEDALALTELPPLVSHTGVRAVHESSRNLSDEQIRAVSERHGVIGVMLAPPALSEPSLHEAIRHLEHVIDVGGEDAAAIGSDFDGYVRAPIDVSGLPVLTELMLRRGFSEQRIRKVLGGNVVRLLRGRQ